MALADSLVGNNGNVSDRMAEMRARIAEVKGKVEDGFNQFAAKTQVADALEKPSDGLREALARIKQTVGSPSAVTASIIKPKENTVA